MPYRSRTSFVDVNGKKDDLPLASIPKDRDNVEKVNCTMSVSGTTLQGGLPTPITQPSDFSGRRGKQKKSARVTRGLRIHWDTFKRKLGTGTAPSTSSALEPDESGDSYSNGRTRTDVQAEESDEHVDEVIVDRQWSDEIKSSSITHSEHGGTPEKSGSNHPNGTNTDRESLALHPEGFWSLCLPLVVLRWRLWPFIHGFFWNHFVDEKSEMHYNKENWFLRKSLALWSSAFLIINWVLAVSFIPKPVTLADKIFYYGVSPALTFPVLPMVMYDFPRDRNLFYQTFLVFSVWSWSVYQIIFMFLCGEYNHAQSRFTCNGKDFLTLFYYTSALQTVGLFGLKLHRFPALLGITVFFALGCGLILPNHAVFVRNLINFLIFQAFLLYVHYMRENAERRLYTLRDQLKIQFRATQKAQVNERKAADSKRRLTSYVFHEVRVPLNTALLAVQNMEAYGSVAKAQEIEFTALEGSLSMMSKVLNDVLDFNRMDSGRFESVLKPYTFHQVMRSMFVPLQLATDARGLEFVTDLDQNIDEVARLALYEAMGKTGSVVDQRLRDDPSKDGVVVGDETRLRQIITNLASNACKFTPAGGKLTISTRLVLPRLPSRDDSALTTNTAGEPCELSQDKEMGGSSASLPLSRSGSQRGESTGEGLSSSMPHRLSATRLTQHNVLTSKPPPPLEWIVVRIEVSDTGYGIRPKDMVQSKLFTAFNQTEQGRLQGGKGTGLGLALVRQIVKLSGGRLGVRSKVNEGSTFWVELPLGVGMKAIPVLTTPPESQDVDAGLPSLSRTKTMKSVALPESPDLRAMPQTPPSRSSSALHSIMEQGGLVEISTKRGDRSPVLTRTIGDPSTGTHAIVEDIPSLPPTDFSSSADTSSETVRPRLSELPKPQTFTLEPPVSPATSSATSSTQAGTATSSSVPDGSLNVLVVDDDPLTRLLMSRMLTRIGCRVTTAENGEAALDLILGNGPRATPSSEDTGSAGLSKDGPTPSGDEYRYAVIFLDNQMPVLSGLDTVAKLREIGRHDFVVGVTGNALLTDQRQYLEAGADHVLTKPVLEKSLKSMLAIADERRKRGPPTSEPARPAL
ncbi:hypothetical protein AcV5_009035 [Taiwanofungus camphoratus]|nr:hypothetical protein AcV5_009035 [Antrodia cinnamomea]KAI0924292.1 hypothetical protein AcW2_005212 [Antrodia cinnamomea]KAI0940860.1 hypothetical protein AcV7_003125 [Antrodia cinnamomea]